MLDEVLSVSSATWSINRVWLASVFCLWVLIVTMVPSIFYFGYGAKNWQSRSANPIQCQSCACMHQDGCWDGRFKGSFPTSGYKSVWFNMDLGSAFIVGNILIYSSLAIEAAKALLNIFLTSHLLKGPFIYFVVLVYPNYYAFWSVFNYINDRNWQLLDNQLFFSLTEGVAAWLCVWLCDPTRASTHASRARGVVWEFVLRIWCSLFWIKFVTVTFNLSSSQSFDQF